MTRQTAVVEPAEDTEALRQQAIDRLIWILAFRIGVSLGEGQGDLVLRQDGQLFDVCPHMANQLGQA